MEPVIETPVEARGGRKGVPVFYVLAASIVLVVVAFGLVALIKPW